MNAIELKQVNFSYDGKTKILENTDFTAEYGEVTLLSGHSGEGKSTLMYIVSGIIPNVNYGELTGEVKIAGEDIKGKKLGTICRKVGVVLQNADEQIIQKVVEDEIAFGCENLAFPPDKIEKQIDIVCNLLKLDKSWKCRTLSGGQKQRLITASTLAMGQKIIILDEPLANLDKDGAAMLMGTLRSLAQAGYCVVVIEHRLDMVLPFVDTVWHIGDKTVKRIGDKAAYLQAQTAKIGDSCKPFEGTAPLFELKNVKFSVKDRGILKDISLDISKGGRTVFLGENGCGKTTLMRLIARLYKPTGGASSIRIPTTSSLCRRWKKNWVSARPRPNTPSISPRFSVSSTSGTVTRSLSPKGRNAASPLPRSSRANPKFYFWTNRRWGRTTTGSARWWRSSTSSMSRRATR